MAPVYLYERRLEYECGHTSERLHVPLRANEADKPYNYLNLQLGTQCDECWLELPSKQEKKDARRVIEDLEHWLDLLLAQQSCAERDGIPDCSLYRNIQSSVYILEEHRDTLRANLARN